MSGGPITSHVLDTSLGTPARGVAVALEVSDGEERWTLLARGRTDGDGRIGTFDPPVGPLRPGVYRLRFATGDYFAARGVATFYPEVPVVVRVDDPAQHYHIPLLLSPFGYSTYRGS
jgi:5-hydroxyisourate hydrolase